VTGTAEQGSLLTAGNGGWSGGPTSFAYQWERCKPSCGTISGATGSSYALTATDVGASLRVRVTASNGNGAGTPAVSAETATVLTNEASITSFTPSGITGSVITIEGTGLDTATQVLLGKLGASFTLVSATKLEAIVPNGASSGKLAVTNAYGAAKGKGKFTVTFTIKSFKPATGAPGTAVTIKGAGFNGSSKVAFDGVPATVISASSSKLKALVPAGAGTGPITVTNATAPAGTVSSAGDYTP
jgi:hypothetical protein